MLRPSKIFVSLHQIRHYVQTRISELAHPPTNPWALQLKHGSTSQQMMTFYTLLQKKAVFSKAPVHTNEKYLLRKIHQHFPVTKVLSSPARQVWTQPCMGFQRPTTALGIGRTFGAARQYSTSPFHPVFQHNAPANSVFAHISSRTFKPTATKLNQVDLDERQSTKLATPTAARKASRIDTNKRFGAKVFVPEPIMTVSETKLGSSIIHHDEVSHLHQEKKPCVQKKKTTQFPPAARSVFMLIPMDATQFWTSKKKRWNTEQLCSSFVDSIEQMAYEYQIHINSVLKLLDRLERHGKFRTVTGHSELRIYFPPSVQSKQEAMLLLDAFHIVDGKPSCFSIEVEDCEFDIEEDEEDSADSSIGPDYFKELQLFLDHTDYLIESSPVFIQR